MKRVLFIFLAVMISFSGLFASEGNKEVYLLSCSAGTESYSIYGHSALRISDSSQESDKVYNWGVFDFDTPNFVLKFARGRLDYKLGVYSYGSFLREYKKERRTVYSQRINMDSIDIVRLEALLKENLKEENLYYRYDFLHDNCATRIRDIIEEVYGERLIYPDSESLDISTFRHRLGEYQKGMPWLDFGVDMLVGRPGDAIAAYSESMFLPDYLMWNLSKAKVNKSGSLILLLEPAEIIFEFNRNIKKVRLVFQPWFLLSILALTVLAATILLKDRKYNNTIDTVIFGILALLAVLLLFLNFFSEHDAMNNNLNLIWLNPLILIAPIIIFSKRKNRAYWLIILGSQDVFLLLLILGVQSVNPAVFPLISLLAIRGIYRFMLE